jgi:hypothetical protein
MPIDAILRSPKYNCAVSYIIIGVASFPVMLRKDVSHMVMKIPEKIEEIFNYNSVIR